MNKEINNKYKYAELKQKHSEQLSQIPFFAAFDKETFNKKLKDLGLTISEVASVGYSCFLPLKDKHLWINHWQTVEREMTEAMQNDDFMIDAIRYELGSHEYCYTWDYQPALDALSLDIDDERVEICLKKAIEIVRKWDEENN